MGGEFSLFDRTRLLINLLVLQLLHLITIGLLNEGLDGIEFA